MMIRMLLWAVFLVGGLFVGFLLDRRYFFALAHNPLYRAISFLLGLGLMAMVLRASRNTGRWLARYGRQGDLPRLETNRLVTTGYYSCMRHPMHFGLLFFPLAVALLVGSPGFTLIVAPAEAFLMILLIKFAEEREALRKFGRAYEEYRRRVPFFSLRWACLKQLFGPAPFPKNAPDAPGNEQAPEEP